MAELGCERILRQVRERQARKDWWLLHGACFVSGTMLGMVILVVAAVAHI